MQRVGGGWPPHIAVVCVLHAAVAVDAVLAPSAVDRAVAADGAAALADGAVAVALPHGTIVRCVRSAALQLWFSRLLSRCLFCV